MRSCSMLSLFYMLPHMYVDRPCMLTYLYMYTKHGYGYMENINRIAAKRNVNIVLQISEMEMPHHTYNLFMQSSIDIARSVCVVGVYKGVYNRRTCMPCFLFASVKCGWLLTWFVLLTPRFHINVLNYENRINWHIFMHIRTLYTWKGWCGVFVLLYTK